MPDIREVLTAQSAEYQNNAEAWRREERRLFGRDAVLNDDDFPKWGGEDLAENSGKYKARKAQATYLNFPSIHAKILAGHLGRVAPKPDWGTLGDVRERTEINSRPTVAELIHYNCDGVGFDGTQFRAWTTGVQERAIATGKRYALVEMPRRVGSADRPLTAADIQSGFRPFFVEFPPYAVPITELTNGQRDFAVIRTKVRPPSEEWEAVPTNDGYYLLVRQGFTGFGDEFAEGGWWLFDPEMERIPDGHGTWERTGGQIPLCELVAESSLGTSELVATSGSLTMELGQIAVALMNLISARNWDAIDAAKSVKYILGADNTPGVDGKRPWDLMVEHHKQNAILIPVVGSINAEGKVQIPQIYDGSSGAVAAEVFSTIISSTIAEAHEIMVRQLTSEADSSGRSKEVGFGEATSPLLASLAARRETFENTLIYFAELRAGAATPTGSVVWPTEFELAPVVAKIDQTIERMLKLGARSATLEATLIESAAKDDGVWPDQQEPEIREQLTASLSAVRPEQTASVQQLTASGSTLEGALESVGVAADQIPTLVGGSPDGSPDQSNPDAGVVVAGEGAVSAIPEGEAVGAGNSAAVVPPSPAVPPPAPQVDLSEVTSRLDALAEQIAALVGALATKQARGAVTARDRGGGGR